MYSRKINYKCNGIYSFQPGYHPTQINIKVDSFNRYYFI